jgi:hypothetical protein
MRNVVAALLVSVTCTGSALAQTDAPARIVGTYKLVSSEQTGYLFYDPSGLMAVVIQQNGRKMFAAAAPTPAEALAAVTTYSGYFGTFTVNEAERVVTHHKLGSFDPNGTGTDEKRSFQFAAGRLILRPSSAAQGVGPTITWERMPDLPNLTPMHRRFIGFHKLLENEIKNEKGEILPGPAGGLDTGGTAANPGQIGYIVYSAAGVMAVHMMQPHRPKYAGALPTGQEAQAILRTYNTYFGSYVIKEAEGYVVHERAGSFKPNTIADVRRRYTFEGNRLTLFPPSTTPGRQGSLAWEALPATSPSQ